MADDAGHKGPLSPSLSPAHISHPNSNMAPFIQLPYVIVSRMEYEWLVFTRNALVGVSVLLGAALWDRCRRKPEPPKEE